MWWLTYLYLDVIQVIHFTIAKQFINFTSSAGRLNASAVRSSFPPFENELASRFPRVKSGNSTLFVFQTCRAPGNFGASFIQKSGYEHGPRASLPGSRSKLFNSHPEPHGLTNIWTVCYDISRKPHILAGKVAHSKDQIGDHPNHNFPLPNHGSQSFSD